MMSSARRTRGSTIHQHRDEVSADRTPVSRSKALARGPLGGSVERGGVSLARHRPVKRRDRARAQVVEQDFVAEITPRLIVAKNVYRTLNQKCAADRANRGRQAQSIVA
jgi:hypothetical protein